MVETRVFPTTHRSSGLGNRVLLVGVATFGITSGVDAGPIHGVESVAGPGLGSVHMRAVGQDAFRFRERFAAPGPIDTVLDATSDSGGDTVTARVPNKQGYSA